MTFHGRHSDVWHAISLALPERIAIRDAGGEEWSYARLAQQSGSLARTLRSRGLTVGDPVAILLHNRPEFIITLFACLAGGFVPVPFNYRFRAAEIADLLDDSGARAIVHPTSLNAVVAEAMDLARDEPEAIAVDDAAAAPVAGTRWQDAVEGATPLPPTAPDGELWLYTGGTTGRPKAAMWDARDMFEAQKYSIYGLSDLDEPVDLDDAVRIAAATSERFMVTLPLAPFMHGTALFASMNALALGGTVLTTSSARLDADAAVELANRWGATRLIVAGDAVTIPLVEAAERTATRLRTVTSVLSSGMRFSPDVKRRLHAIADVQIFDMLASTEAGAFAVTTTTGPGDLPGRPRLLPHATVLDEDLEEVRHEVGARGLLALRGAMPKGYRGDTAKTRETFPTIRGRRHVVPGDWVRVEEDLHIELLGRGSSVVNTGGEKVYPLEVEEALLSHPLVDDAVVFGISDRRFGEIVAAVVATPEPGLAVEDLIAHIDPLIAGYKKPRTIALRPSLNRTPHGKIDLVRLRADVQAGSSAPKETA
ncbi:AMP-binding protein [Microbacterium sp. 18062]|uniref:AMP-binding protein n=1 Tax=Microbacterium sp. 18062 TaxID=2681410 RepID=UPI001357EA9F|nr:AMP-binding protein [Microbacterium sp. 18062]